MKKVLLSTLMVVGFAFAGGGVCPTCPDFAKLSKVEQDKIIQKDFKILHEMFAKLNGIISSIDKTRDEISKLKKDMRTRNRTCLALSLIKLDLTDLNTKLQTIHDKNSEKYKSINANYIDQKHIYDTENLKTKCEGH